MSSAALPRAGTRTPGREAIAKRGWWAAHRWLLARRASQLAILTLFLLGPWAGIWWVKGNLSSSLTLGVLPLTDPYILLQSLASAHWPAREAVLGAGIVLAAYLMFGGRLFCSWVCPMNLVTDAAAWLRRRLGLKGSHAPAASTRHVLLVGTLIAAITTGSLAWEWVNPVSLLQRGLIFGFGATWGVVAAVFTYDLLVAPRGWCGHLCPHGAFYGLLGRLPLPSQVRVSAHRAGACNDCMDCFTVCPEPHVIRPALKRAAGQTPLIASADCTACGRCVDVCSESVFKLTMRFDQRSES